MSLAAGLNRRIAQLAVGRHLPPRTVRLRLTLLYGGLFLASGAALMAIAYALLVNAGFVFTLQNGATNGAVNGRPLGLVPKGSSTGFPAPGANTHPSTQTMARSRNVARCMRQHGVSQFPNPTTSVPRNFLRSRELPSRVANPAATGRSPIAEVSDQKGAIFVIPATVNRQSATFKHAQLVCGFEPDHIRAIAAADRRRTQVRQELLIQSGIALAGMSLLSLGLGWLMAGRVLQPLEDSYHAQRQFVANASHELRAPLTRLRALCEVALASPEPNVASLLKAHERVLASEQHLEQLIDALLALTRGQAGLERRERLDLATVASQAMLARESQLAGLDLDVHATLDRGPMDGDPRLLERLIANLIDNAIRHNKPGGHVEITTGTRDRRAFLAITNTGPTIEPGQIQRLFQPFQGLGGARTQHNGGHGLGLSIVQAIANAHHAELSAHARPDGGLTIEISFPPASGASSNVTSSLPGRHAPARAPLSETDAPARG